MLKKLFYQNLPVALLLFMSQLSQFSDLSKPWGSK